MPTNVIKVVVSDETARKLSLAYVGLSAQRRSVVDERVKKDNVSKEQATLDEILNPRIEIYYNNGVEETEKIISMAVAIKSAQGWSKEKIEEFLRG